MEFDIDAILLGQPQHQIAGHPHFVSGLLGALAENLEFPLALRDFGVDAFVVMPAARQRSRCSSTILRATSPTFL